MKNENTVMIIVLLATAAVLGLMLAGSLGPGRAAAAGAGDRTSDGDYIMLTGQVTDKSCLVYVIHVPTRTLIVFVPSRTTNTLKLLDFAKLNRVF